jgi:hypothetical protein
MYFQGLRKFSRRIVRYSHVAVLIAMTSLSPVSFALQITLGSAMKVRTLNGNSLNAVGVLAIGSVVEIPDRFKMRDKKTGKVDPEASFNNWLLEAGFDQQDIDAPVPTPRKDFYYPVRIVSLGKGSNADGLVGKTRFMALRVLEHSHGGLKVKETARIYAGSKSLTPVKPLAKQPQRSADDSTPAPRAAPRPAPAAPAETSAVAQSKSKPSRAAKEQDALTNHPVSQPSQGDPQMEATSQEEKCPECDAAQAADELKSKISGSLPALYNSEAKNEQGLGRGFAANCSSFIKSDGTYGPWGQTVIKEIMNSKANGKTSDFLANWDMTNAKAKLACPNFNHFSDAQKRHYWVYAIAALSMEEASCKPNISDPVGGNAFGHAVGLMQIEEIALYRRGRDIVYGGQFCSGAHPKETGLNLRCGIRMVDDVVRLGHGPYEIQTASHIYENYYSSFRKSGTLARNLISQYGDCGSNATQMQASHKHAKRHHRRHA